MKIPHHGSNTSTSAKLLNIFNPKYVIINEAQNSNDTPSYEVMNRLWNLSSIERIFITGYNGNIVFKSNGDKITYVITKTENKTNFKDTFKQ